MKRIFILAFTLLLICNVWGIKVGVVVEFPDGKLWYRCLNVEENEDGYRLMEKTGLNLEWSYYNTLGHALCKIENTGCPASNCFCNDKYWNFYTAGIGDREWRYSSVGFDGGSSCNEHYCAKYGDLLGFAYGGFGTKPKFFEFRDVCRSNKRRKNEFNVIFNNSASINEIININVSDKRDGKGIKNAIVEVFEGLPGISKIIFSGKTDKNGSVSFSINREGKYKIRIITNNKYTPVQKILDLYVYKKAITTTTSTVTTTTESTITTTSTVTTTTLTTTKETGNNEIVGMITTFQSAGILFTILLFLLLVVLRILFK